MAFSIKSNSFAEGSTLPKKHTCDGADISPELRWSDSPEGVRSFALIMDDPDAPVGTWVHWVLYNLPAATTALHEAVEAKETLPNGTHQGLNDFKKIGYGGPCPPKGPVHRYFFKLYALDTMLSLNAKATKAEVEKGMKGHILGQTQLVGKYGR